MPAEHRPRQPRILSLPRRIYAVLGIGVPSCAPFILARTAPGIFTGSCSSDDGTNHIEWTGDIRQVGP